MRWQIENFIFCERQQILTSAQKVQQLEPIVVELLSYFCRNPEQIISRSQLIDEVWSGRVVTDNAVNKVITKLRKTLDDDAKRPRFIATFPKKGYKFIASISPLTDRQIKSESKEIGDQDSTFTASTAEHKHTTIGLEKIGLKSSFSITHGIFLVLLGVILAVSWMLEYNQNSEPVALVKALTRSAGRESAPQVSPDGQYLAYTERTETKIHLWIKSLVDESQVEISHGDDRFWVGPASWNSDGSQIAYLVTTSESCQYYVRSINGLSSGKAKLIHNCPVGSYGEIAFTHNDQNLIYTESEGRGTAYSLFEININTGDKRRLNQPELYLAGNSQFDLHPSENKLLISSPDKQQWEGYYSLDLTTDELKLLFKQDAYICCGIWDHSGERVVLMGEHPAYQLVSYNLQGQDRQVIYAGSQMLLAPERHINGRDYLFVAGNFNQDIQYYHFLDSTSLSVANSSVDDRLATFASHSDQIAYVGLSSGHEEVWLTDRSGKNTKKLTNFADSRHYIELLWSYNGDYLLGLVFNEIHLINSRSGEYKVLKIPQAEIRGLSWKNNQTVSYSVKEPNGWRVHYYNIRNHSVSVEKERWSFIHYAQNVDDILRLDRAGQLYVGESQSLLEDIQLSKVDVLDRRVFNLKKQGSLWAWQRRVGEKYHLMIKEESNQKAQSLLVSDSYYFDISKNGALFHTVKNLNTDIYQSVGD